MALVLLAIVLLIVLIVAGTVAAPKCCHMTTGEELPRRAALPNSFEAAMTTAIE